MADHMADSTLRIAQLLEQEAKEEATKQPVEVDTAARSRRASAHEMDDTSVGSQVIR
jgi:hypothetical protein